MRPDRLDSLAAVKGLEPVAAGLGARASSRDPRRPVALIYRLVKVGSTWSVPSATLVAVKSFGARSAEAGESVDSRQMTPSLAALSSNYDGRLSQSHRRTDAINAILLGGLTAGVIDILDAFLVAVVAGGSPMRILQAIASGLLGPAAYRGGAVAAAIGLGLHFLISFSVALVYVAASRRLMPLVRRPVLSGVCYGLCVWAFMYFVVLPITFGRPYQLPSAPLFLNQLGIHALGVGLPIAMFTARSAENRR